jgi:hypothetical protein
MYDDQWIVMPEDPIDLICDIKAKHYVKLRCMMHKDSKTAKYNVCDYHFEALQGERDDKYTKVDSYGEKQSIINSNKNRNGCMFRAVFRKNRVT